MSRGGEQRDAGRTARPVSSASIPVAVARLPYGVPPPNDLKGAVVGCYFARAEPTDAQIALARRTLLVQAQCSG